MSEQVPVLIALTVAAETTQIFGVALTKLTANPLVALADNFCATCVVFIARGAVKRRVCAALVRVITAFEVAGK